MAHGGWNIVRASPCLHHTWQSSAAPSPRQSAFFGAFCPPQIGYATLNFSDKNQHLCTVIRKGHIIFLQHTMLLTARALIPSAPITVSDLPSLTFGNNLALRIDVFCAAFIIYDAGKHSTRMILLSI